MMDATRLLHTCTKNEGDTSLRQGIGPKLPATSRDSKGLGVSTNPFEMLDDCAYKAIEELEVTIRFAFKTRHRAYTREFQFGVYFRMMGARLSIGTSKDIAMPQAPLEDLDSPSVLTSLMKNLQME